MGDSRTTSVLAFFSWTNLADGFRVLLHNPQIRELLRFMFLGTVLETGRQCSYMIIDNIQNAFVITAEISMSDLASDWVIHYLEHHRLWNESRSFKVAARIPELRRGQNLELIKNSISDGHPDALYEPASATPTFLRWRGYWISITKSLSSMMWTDRGYEPQGSLTLSIWSTNRRALDEFIQEARRFYLSQAIPPRKIDYKQDQSGGSQTLRFRQDDASYLWVLEWFKSADTYENITVFDVSTKQSDASWTEQEGQAVSLVPTSQAKQLYHWNGQWLQYVIVPGTQNWKNQVEGGEVTVTLFTTKRAVLDNFVEAVRVAYMSKALRRVTVHLPDNHGSWMKTVQKSRRSLDSLVLPKGIKESLLDDAREFLASEQWYQEVGVPYRRGYLLHGEPGTGKSSTIHALAGELGLEVYCISLAAPGVDDYSLGNLISNTPARCILLIEDIDCAFPSRDTEADDEPLFDVNGKMIQPGITPPRSLVTLAGLLNVLDSVSSEEGRLTFATTNHVDQLDPALTRAGRMDVKVRYSLAIQAQVEDIFKRFYFESKAVTRKTIATAGDAAAEIQPLTQTNVLNMAKEFAYLIPEDTFSIAQVQSFLLTKKNDPTSALSDIAEWVRHQEEEKRELAEVKRKKRAEVLRRKMEAEEYMKNATAAVGGCQEGMVDAEDSVREGNDSPKPSEVSPTSVGSG